MSYLQNGRRSKKYCAKLRTFALTLHFYSPIGYKYVRSVFNDGLPSISRKWYSAINGKPGFSTEAFEALKRKAIDANTAGNEILACLIFDEVAIRKQLEFDEHNNVKIGMVNFGTNLIEQDDSKYAKEALVYMVAGVNENFKIPVAYFLISGLKADEKAALTQWVILNVGKTGIKITGLSFDGLVANFSMARQMGADIENDKPYIENPHSDDKIYLFPDACHMLKLIRNRFASKKILYDAANDPIEWRFVEALVKYQQDENLNLGNQINKKHLQWEKRKMSVRLAAQTLSNGVADSIDFLRNKGVDEFQGSAPTTHFICRNNNIFDILNSRKESATCYKQSISSTTKDVFFKYFDESIEYIRNLKLSRNGRSILHSKSKTPFVGLIIDMQNFQSFYAKYVESNIIPCIYTFRFSQDHLELLFASIRQMFGCNDNPSCRQFESAWRRLLGQHQITASEAANCENNDTQYLTVLNSSSRKETNVKFKKTLGKDVQPSANQQNCGEPAYEMDDEEIWNLRSLILDSGSSNIENHMISYTASVLQNKIIEGKWYSRIKCAGCFLAFSEDEHINDEFVNLKMRTKNVRPAAKSTFQICMTTEKLMQKSNYEPKNYDRLTENVLKILSFDELFPFSYFETHDEPEHKSVLINMIMKMYIKKRQEYICHCKTLAAHDAFIRHKLKKLVHFRGQ